MCVATGTPPTFVCTVGDLKAGQTYHDPNGETWMVVDIKRSQLTGFDSTDVMVVNLGNAQGGYNPYGRNGDEYAGKVVAVYGDVKLGHDHKGRLYASTFLNDWYDYIPAVGNDGPVPPADPTAQRKANEDAYDTLMDDLNKFSG